MALLVWNWPLTYIVSFPLSLNGAYSQIHMHEFKSFYIFLSLYKETFRAPDDSGPEQLPALVIQSCFSEA